MNAYDLILEKLNEKVEYGELTIEQAEEVNILAYEKYVLEGAPNKVVKKPQMKQNNFHAQQIKNNTNVDPRHAKLSKQMIKQNKEKADKEFKNTNNENDNPWLHDLSNDDNRNNSDKDVNKKIVGAAAASVIGLGTAAYGVHQLRKARRNAKQELTTKEIKIDIKDCQQQIKELTKELKTESNPKNIKKINKEIDVLNNRIEELKEML